MKCLNVNEKIIYAYFSEYAKLSLTLQGEIYYAKNKEVAKEDFKNTYIDIKFSKKILEELKIKNLASYLTERETYVLNDVEGLFSINEYVSKDGKEKLTYQLIITKLGKIERYKRKENKEESKQVKKI